VKLYVDPRSSASLRVLTYIEHKGVALEIVPLDLFAGDHRRDDYAALNPSRTVPALDLGADGVIAQSLPILELLEARDPASALLPTDDVARARVRSLCCLIAADIHPLTNMRVRLEVERIAGDAASRLWVRQWTETGLVAVEAWLARRIWDASPLAPYDPTEMEPGPALQTDEQLLAHARASAITVFHPVGTCRMGKDPDAVVDARLRVHGLAGLRVADASIMPTIPSGNTAAAAVMIGEKAAELIREDRTRQSRRS